MNTLINSIYESKEEVRIELIDMMADEVTTKKGLILGDLSRVFIMISQMLIDQNKQVILSTHKLINSLIDFLLPAELEGGLKLFQNQLVHNLADSDRQIRKSTKSIFMQFIAKTRNAEQVLELLSGSFSNKNFYVRERAINLVPDIFTADKSVFCNRTGINEVRKIMECIIIHLNDVNESVQQTSRKVIRNIKSIEGFEQVYRRLAVEHQNVIDKIQREMPPKIDKFIELNIQIQEHTDPLIDEFVPGDFLQKNYNLDDFPLDLQNKLYFGFLSKEILQDTLNQKDLSVREKGVAELNSQFFEDSEQELSVNSKVIDKIVKGGFMPSFFKYISSLFTCEDFRVVNMLLNIIGKIMQVPGIHVNVYLPLSLPGLIQCLKDDRVIIRQRSLFLLKQMNKYFRKKQYFQNLIYFIEQPMDNWHQKEELINLISYLILCIEPTEQWFYEIDDRQTSIKQENQPQERVFNLREVDFKKSLISIAQYLNDPIAKVKFASLECLSVMAYLNKSHLQYLHEVLNQQVYDKINDKVENGIVYFINDNGNLELPQFNVKKMEEQRESVKQSQIVESVVIEQKPQTPIESEKSEESKFKVTYYYDKFPMSMNDKIIRSNASLESLFASEHKNNQGMKYDMIIPIGQIQQTKANEQFKLINSNVYLEKIDANRQFDDEVMPSSEDEQLEAVEFEYPTRTLKYRGHAPEQITQSKYQPIDDVKSRVYNTIKQLNEDVNVDLQIPKVIKANVGAYQGYKYEEELTSFQESDEEIFIDYKKIKQEHKLKPKQDSIENSTQQTIDVNNPDTKIEQVQEILQQQQLIFTPEQRYQKRLEEFLLSFENRDLKQKGKNARKLKRQLKETSQKEELPKVFDMPVRIDNARAETAALLINLSSLDIELLSISLHKFRVLLQNHLTDVYASQVPLLQIISDVCRLLSTQNDNPLYAADFSRYKKIPSQTLVRKIVFIAMQTLSVAVQTLRTALVEVQKMFTVCGVWLQDENKQVSQQAEQTMLDILRFCDDSQLSDILPKLYHKNSFNSKIYVGVLIEHLVIKYAKGIFKSNHFNSIIKLISQMVIDQSFDVRRLGKKVFFKILTYGSYQVEDIVMQMHQQEKDQMRELLKRYEELVSDHQIGIFDQDEYMGLQAVPQSFGFEYEMIDDQLYMN